MSIGAAIGSALIGASGARKAAKAQERAADKSAQVQREIYEDTSGNFEKYRESGDLARAAYMYEMGLGQAPVIGGTAPQITTVQGGGSGGSLVSRAGGPHGIGQSQGQGQSDPMTDYLRSQGANVTPFYAPGQQAAPASATQYQVGGKTFGTMEEAQAWANANPTGGTTYGGYTKTPGYDFRLQQGNDNINALAGAGGGLVSGKSLKALNQWGQDYATGEYTNHLNRLSGLTNMGTAAAANQANAGANYASGVSNAYTAAGNAQANGYMNAANALSGGIGNAYGVYRYQQGLTQ